MPLPFPSGRRARAWLLAALSAVALLVIGGLAREAWRATERHRAAAEGSLRDHAGLAALAFRQQYISRIWLASDGVFRGVDRGNHPDPGPPPPPVGVLREAADRYARCGDCGSPVRPTYFFRIVVADSTLEVDGDSLPPDRRAHLIRQALDLPLRRDWQDWDFASFVDTLAPGLDVVFLSEWRDGEGRPVAIYGYAMGLEAVAATYLRPVLDGPPLLPAPGRRADNDSLLAVSLLRPDGRIALELSSRRLPETYAARIHASRLLGGWTLRLALDPAAAPALLVGGLPHARTGLLTALLAVAALLILATIALARLWVEDEGPGIPPADRARVWRPFVRLERDVDRQAAGSGIGLSLVREIVSRHRGMATIESTPAGGTRVVVELPDARPAAEVPCAS